MRFLDVVSTSHVAAFGISAVELPASFQSPPSILGQVYLDGNFMHTQRRAPLVPNDGARSFGPLTFLSAGAATGVVAVDNITIQAGNALAAKEKLAAGLALWRISLSDRHAAYWVSLHGFFAFDTSQRRPIHLTKFRLSIRSDG